MTPDQTRIEAIRERHARATPGEWRRGDYLAVQGKTEIISRYLAGEWKDHVATIFPIQLAWANDVELSTPIMAEDADFIAHAHQDIPYLLDQLTLARAQASEDAVLIREALVRLLPIFVSPNSHLCRACLRDSRSGPEHEPDCIVTKLHAAVDRASADRADGGGSPTRDISE